MRNTRVGTSDNIIRRKELAKLTLILSMVNLSSPRSSVRETIRGMYLLDALTEWNGAEEAVAESEAEDIIGFVLGSKRWIRLYIISL